MNFVEKYDGWILAALLGAPLLWLIYEVLAYYRRARAMEAAGAEENNQRQAYVPVKNRPVPRTAPESGKIHGRPVIRQDNGLNNYFPGGQVNGVYVQPGWYATDFWSAYLIATALSDPGHHGDDADLRQTESNVSAEFDATPPAESQTSSPDVVHETPAVEAPWQPAPAPTYEAPSYDPSPSYGGGSYDSGSSSYDSGSSSYDSGSSYGGGGFE